MKKLLCISLLFLLWTPCGFAQKEKEPATPKLTAALSKKQPPGEIGMQLEKFFVGIHENRVEDAFKNFLTDSEHLKRRYDVKEFIQKTRKAMEIYGRVHAYELYDNRRVSARLMYLTYFVYLDAIPLRWRFVYYNPTGSKWFLINLSVDDLLDESLLKD